MAKPVSQGTISVAALAGLLIGGVILFVAGENFVMKSKNERLANLENPRLVIRKSERVLEVFDGDELVRTYRIALGFAPEGDKQIEGDGKTPEGEFYVFVKNDRSKFYLSLGLSYPAIDDARRGLAENLITPNEYEEIVRAAGEKKMPPQKTRLGGEIYIHGGGFASDWTEGCMALENEQMKELFDATPLGTRVTVLP